MWKKLASYILCLAANLQHDLHVILGVSYLEFATNYYFCFIIEIRILQEWFVYINFYGQLTGFCSMLKWLHTWYTIDSQGSFILTKVIFLFFSDTLSLPFPPLPEDLWWNRDCEVCSVSYCLRVTSNCHSPDFLPAAHIFSVSSSDGIKHIGWV